MNGNIRVFSDNVFIHFAIHHIIRQGTFLESRCAGKIIIIDGGNIHRMDANMLRSACHVLIFVEFRTQVNLVNQLNPGLSITCLPARCTVDFLQAVLMKIVLGMHRKTLCPRIPELHPYPVNSQKLRTFMRYFMRGETVSEIAEKMNIKRKTSEHYRTQTVSVFLGRLSGRTVRLYHALQCLPYAQIIGPCKRGGLVLKTDDQQGRLRHVGANWRK